MTDYNAEDKFVLHYFDGFGRGELIRFILHYAKVDFNDNRIPFLKWPSFKKTTPLGQVPVLEITHSDGTKTTLAQSGTIARYLAQRFDLSGKNEMETALADEIVECCVEFLNVAVEGFFEADPAKQAKNMEFFEQRQTAILGYFEKCLEERDSKFIAGGEELTYADLALASLYDIMASSGNDVTEATKSYPKLNALVDFVRETETIKEYRANRPADRLFSFRKVLVMAQKVRNTCILL